MFEKEAKQYGDNYVKSKYMETVDETWKKGAEFGFNKAKKDADKMKSRFLELCNLKDMRIAELEKAKEWHYVKNELPDNEEDVLCQIAKDEFVVGYYHKKNEVFYTISGEFINVIAWKEIVPPKEIE